MQRTADTLTIRVGEEKTRLVLTDSAVVAVQEEAAGNASRALSDLPDAVIGADFLDYSFTALVEARDNATELLEALDGADRLPAAGRTRRAR